MNGERAGKYYKGGLLMIMGGKRWKINWTKYRRNEKFGGSDIEHSVPYTGFVIKLVRREVPVGLLVAPSCLLGFTYRYIYYILIGLYSSGMMPHMNNILGTMMMCNKDAHCKSLPTTLGPVYA